MAANIFGDRFVGNRRPAWHAIGQVFEDTPTVTEAFKRGKLDYRVCTEPVSVQAFGQTINDPGRMAIVREPTVDDPEPRVFGYAGKQWEALQNLEIAEMLDPLCKEWPVETVGALGLGQFIFVTLDAGSHNVGGEEVKSYLLISEGKTGGTAMKVAVTPVRVVCQNTLVSGMKRATIKAAVTHNASVRRELAFQINIIAEVKHAQARVFEAFNHMAATHLEPLDARQVLAQTYPMPKRPQKAQLLDDIQAQAQDSEVAANPDHVLALQSAADRHEYYTTGVMEIRENVYSLYERFNEEQPKLANTKWALYNAVVEASDYRRGKNDEVVAVSTIFGVRAAEKERCFAALLPTT